MNLEVFTETELAEMSDQELSESIEFSEGRQAQAMRTIDRLTNTALSQLDLFDKDGSAEHIEQIRDALQRIQCELKGYDNNCAVICDVNQERERRAQLVNN